MKQYNHEVRVLINSKPAKEYYHDNKYYVEGRQGTEYSLKLKNSSPYKCMAIVTVDGVNVVSGCVGGDIGYIMAPHSAITVSGFRQDLDTVGKFKFCERDNSYCNEVGKSGNNGVIGVRFYREKQTPIQLTTNDSGCGAYYRYRGPLFNDGTRTIDNRPPPFGDGWLSPNEITCSHSINDVDNSSVNMNLGTTWGSKLESHVTEVEFECGQLESELILYYASKNMLKRIGIVFGAKLQLPTKLSMPSAFGEKRFATPPKNWKFNK